MIPQQNLKKSIAQKKEKQKQNNSVKKPLLGQRQAQTWCAPARGASDGKVKEKSELKSKCTKKY